MFSRFNQKPFTLEEANLLLYKCEFLDSVMWFYAVLCFLCGAEMSQALWPATTTTCSRSTGERAEMRLSHMSDD